ncbi:hypothetical protein F2Q69_00048435 [Brassica cretica]|uniref:Retrotransposon gag domain-containing protein n=1 Tax=Brassica cretica TaxID=69181 RepID=A0A8S9PTB1_BRACR|nr:hypothetical protein F2Q69_00048435 [Brassica cretica]
MGQQVKWPPKMRGPDSFRNPDLWCEFHRDHGHKTEDCVALKIEVNELLQKGYLLEFLSEKAKNLLSMETPRKSAETKPATGPSDPCHIQRFGDKRHPEGPETNKTKGTQRAGNERRRPRNSPRLNINCFVWSLLDPNQASPEVVKTQSPFDSRSRREASYLERWIPVTITSRKSSGPRTRTKFTSSSRFIPEKHHSPAQKMRQPIGTISTCCQIPWHPGDSGQIRVSRSDQPEKDDCGPRPRSPKSMMTPWSFQKGGTRLEAGPSTIPGQKISRPPKLPKKIATSTGSLGQAQPMSNARTNGSEKNPISPGIKLVEKPPGLLDPRLAIPQMMKGGTLSALSTTPRLIIRGNAKLSARDQPNRWHTTKSYDEQAETETFQQGDEHAARELDSDQLPSGRMRNPNRPTGPLTKLSREIPRTLEILKDLRVQIPINYGPKIHNHARIPGVGPRNPYTSRSKADRNPEFYKKSHTAPRNQE